MVSEERTEVLSRLLLDVVIRKCTPIFKLLASKDQVLLVRWNTLIVLKLCFYIVDGIRRFNFKHNVLDPEDPWNGLFCSSLLVLVIQWTTLLTCLMLTMDTNMSSHLQAPLRKSLKLPVLAMLASMG